MNKDRGKAKSPFKMFFTKVLQTQSKTTSLKRRKEILLVAI